MSVDDPHQLCRVHQTLGGRRSRNYAESSETKLTHYPEPRTARWYHVRNEAIPSSTDVVGR